MIQISGLRIWNKFLDCETESNCSFVNMNQNTGLRKLTLFLHCKNEANFWIVKMDQISGFVKLNQSALLNPGEL